MSCDTLVTPRSVTLITVPAVECAEIVALEIFRQCESSGQPLTMPMIERALHQLRAHRHDCGCGLCAAAAQASADAVYQVATMWQQGRWPRPWTRTAVTRRRAMR
jgi:hypothetical protein